MGLGQTPLEANDHPADQHPFAELGLSRIALRLVGEMLVHVSLDSMDR